MRTTEAPMCSAMPAATPATARCAGSRYRRRIGNGLVIGLFSSGGPARTREACRNRHTPEPVTTTPKHPDLANQGVVRVDSGVSRTGRRARILSMTNPPAANEPAPDQPAERDTALHRDEPLGP